MKMINVDCLAKNIDDDKVIILHKKARILLFGLSYE